MRALHRRVMRAVRREDGLGLVELMIALTVLAVGILAVFAGFLSSEVSLRRASATTTAMTIVDARIEALRRGRFAAIGHTTTALAAADATYQADSAYRAPDADADGTPNEAAEAVTIASSGLQPTATVTGPDGASYRVDTYVVWEAVTGGRNVKLATVVVSRTLGASVVRARGVSSFDEASGT